jgi:RHS repeat-associated protein
MATKIDRNGVTTAYTYDIFGRLLTEDAGGQVQSYTYDANGNMLTMADAMGTTTRAYDTLNRNISKEVPVIGLSTYEYDLPAENPGEHAERTTDPKGNVTLKTYDKVGRLSKVTLDNDITEYDYYRHGRQFRVNYPDGTTETYAYDKVNRITKLVNAKEGGSILSSYQYTYDGAGNQLTKYEAKGTTTYTYDSLAQGYRVEKQVNNKTIRYLYEADKVVLETDESNNLTAYQVYGAALIYRSTSADSELGVQSYYYLYSAHGDVTALMNSEGDVAVTYDYDAFGNIISQTGAADNAIKYAGYQHDEESGLYYLNARYYDSVTARFITEDTYTGQKNDPLSLNLYTYCYNNPIIYNDPTGHVAGSVVDYLKSQKDDSSFAARKEIAKDLGIKNYTGTAAQNSQMLKELQKQDAAKEKAALLSSASKKVNEVIPQKDDKGGASSQETGNDNVYYVPGDSNNNGTPDQYEFNSNPGTQGTGNAANTGYVITAQSENLVDVAAPDYPYISPEAAFVFGFDSYAGGLITGGLNVINGLTGNQQITQDVINYNMEHTYGFRDKYVAGQAAGLATIVGSIAAALYSKGAGKSNIEITADDISFSDKFSKPQYKNQVADRGWTNESIANTINNPYKTGTTTNQYTGNSVTLYYSDKVHYVAVDNGTGKVIQVADLAKSNWKMDLTK